MQHVGQLPVQLACNFLRQTVLGLHHAFERGLGHCNIKPENILIAGYQPKGHNSDSSSSSAVPRGAVKILNLGLAHLGEGNSLFVGGTPPPTTRPVVAISLADYVAPETALNSKSADIRSDIYSMGCILYFTLASRTPFPGGTASEKCSAHQTREAVLLEKFRPDLPARWGT